jgi:hypothetical protein
LGRPGLLERRLCIGKRGSPSAGHPQKSRTIFAGVFQDNPGSARVLTNCGFACTGDAESFSVARNARVPTWTYLKKLD